MSIHKYTPLLSATEIWMPIPNYEGFYEASDMGRIKRIAGSPFCREDRIVQAHPNIKTRYLHVVLTKNRVKTNISVHRLVMLAFVGQKPDGKEINHINGVRQDNRLANLEYVTHIENIRHAMNVLGYKMNFNAKLTDDEVREIRKLIGTMSQRKLADKYNISDTSIRDIKTGKTYRRVT